MLQLNERGVGIEFLSERLVFDGNNDDAFAKLQLQLMGAFAEFEHNIIRKRQAEGIAKAKANGVYDNRKRKKKVSDKRIFELIANGFNKTEIAETLGVGRITLHRCLSKVAKRVQTFYFFELAILSNTIIPMCDKVKPSFQSMK